MVELIVAELDAPAGASPAASRIAVQLSRTREVLRLGPITPVPTAPPSFVGAMNAGGQVLPVIDAGLLAFGVASNPAPGDSGLLTSVLEHHSGRANEVNCVLYVGRVLEVTRADESAVSASLAAAATAGGGGALSAPLSLEIGEVQLLDVVALVQRIARDVDEARRRAFPTTLPGGLSA